MCFRGLFCTNDCGKEWTSCKTPLRQSKGSCKSGMNKNQPNLKLWYHFGGFMSAELCWKPAIVLLSVVDRGRSQAGCLRLQASELLALARDGGIPGFHFRRVSTFDFLTLTWSWSLPAWAQAMMCASQIQSNSFLSINKITYLKRIWSSENHVVLTVSSQLCSLSFIFFTALQNPPYPWSAPGEWLLRCHSPSTKSTLLFWIWCFYIVTDG